VDYSPRWCCNLFDGTGALTAEGSLQTSHMGSPNFSVPHASGQHDRQQEYSYGDVH